MKLNLKEVETDPDVVEQAEKLAEQFRSSLYENQELDDWVVDYIGEQLDLTSDIEDSIQIGIEEAAETELAVIGIIGQLLRPMIEKVLEEPQFQPNA